MGKPTIFLTLSAAEKLWPELIQLLSKLILKKNMSIEEAIVLDDYTKNYLIRSDPVTCARYFDYRVTKFMLYLKQVDGPFKEFYVEDSYERVEFQMRGSPHEHIFLWLKCALSYKSDDENSINKCVEFIDKFLTCNYDSTNPFVNLLHHRHTQTCNKGKRNAFKCRLFSQIHLCRKQ